MNRRNTEVKTGVTIVAAVVEDGDSLLLGCDAQGCESGELKVRSQPKLQRHPSGKLAWSHAGNTGLVGSDFDCWLRPLSLPDKWDQLRDLAVDKLARLNGKQRRLVQKSGATPQVSDTCSCLMVGCLDSPQILELDAAGKASYYTPQGFHAVGDLKLFYAAYRSALCFNGPNINAERRLRVALEVVCDLSLVSGRPIQMLRVSAGGIEDVV